MSRYFVSIPRQWASFRFDCINKDEAVAFFERSTKFDQFATLFIHSKENRNIVARKEDGKLSIRKG